MDFYTRVGPVALGSRLRRLGDQLADEAARICALYGVDLQPRWFPVIYVLAERGEETVTALAEEIGHSHVSVSQIVAEMVKQGYARQKKLKSDGRKTLVSLSAKGKSAMAAMQAQIKDVGQVVQKLQRDSGADLWGALAACEKALARENLFERVHREKEERESGAVKIVAYSSQYAAAFKSLNEEWISTYFEIEAADRRALDDPEEYILKRGGHILLALLNGEPIASCALISHSEGCFELAKMAVDPKVRGRGIGRLIAQATLRKAKDEGARRVYLESNTRLQPAIRLYRKLGFREIKGGASPYRRCDIQMELYLDPL
jgi:GNAT superfamily N-acetyltransferase/DNA-binding PadR family transcriptional regulator